jgi:hypothetical protein
MVRTREALYGNYLQRPCDCPDDIVSPFGRGSQTGKIFGENLRHSGRTMSTVRTAPIYFTVVVHLNLSL